MKRIFLLLVSASVASVSCSGGGSSSVGKPGTKGEWIPREKTSSFVAERPYGMVAIPAGSFIAGLSDKDLTDNPEKAPLKTVTVSSFFMDEAETTNAEYRVFINYVRDSIARTMLAEAAGEGGDGGGRGQSIGDYAYLAKKEENLTPYQEYLDGAGGRDGFDESKRLDWKIPLHWNTSKYPDVEYAEVGDRIIQNYIRTKGDDFRKIKTVYLNKEKQVQLGLNDRKFGG